MAPVPVLPVCDIAAVVTGLAFPIAERDIWAVRVVGIENAANHRKEIDNPAFFQSCTNCGRAIPFTDVLSVHMRMSYKFIACRRVRFQGNYPVRTAAVQTVQADNAELYLKGPQVYAVQGDRVSSNSNRAGLSIEYYLPEFLLQCRQFTDKH